MKDLFDKNFKFLKKEIEEDTRKWKDLPCSWIGRINITILPKAIYRFNAIPIKIPSNFFTDLERTIIKFIWQNKKPRIAKTILYNKSTSEGITILDFKLYYRATVMKTAWYWHKTGMLTNGIESKTQILIHKPMNTWFSTKELKLYNGRKKASLTNGAGITGMSTCRRMKIDPYLSPCTKLKSKWIKDLNINLTTLNLIEEKVGRSIQDIGTGDHFQGSTPVAQTIRE